MTGKDAKSAEARKKGKSSVKGKKATQGTKRKTDPISR